MRPVLLLNAEAQMLAFGPEAAAPAPCSQSHRGKQELPEYRVMARAMYPTSLFQPPAMTRICFVLTVRVRRTAVVEFRSWDTAEHRPQLPPSPASWRSLYKRRARDRDKPLQCFMDWPRSRVWNRAVAQMSQVCRP